MGYARGWSIVWNLLLVGNIKATLPRLIARLLPMSNTPQPESALVKTLCPRCGKPVRQRQKASLSAWVFRGDSCVCSLAPGAAREVTPIKRIDSSGKTTVETQILSLGLPERYKILFLRGQGGMGSVFKIQDQQDGNYYAMKVMRADLATDQAYVKRFEREAKAAAQLHHPSLVTVHDYGFSATGAPYAVMDYVEGQSLSELLNTELCLDPQRALNLFKHLANAIAHAHSKGIVHRDLKPGNILISEVDGVEIPKVVDFGIAKIMPVFDRSTQQLTQTGDIFGSPLYMSPEQCRGDNVDYRCDVYSLGCVMFETLTGKPPFVGDNPVKTILKHLQERPENLSVALKPLGLPKGCEKAIVHCLEKDPYHRYQFLEELSKDLDFIQKGQGAVIAKQHEDRRDTGGVKPWQKVALAACSIALVVAYMVSLGRYDTMTALGKFFSSLAHIACAFVGLSLACFTGYHFRQTMIRIGDVTSRGPADNWLLLVCASFFLYCCGISIAGLLDFLRFNDLEFGLSIPALIFGGPPILIQLSIIAMGLNVVLLFFWLYRRWVSTKNESGPYSGW